MKNLYVGLLLMGISSLLACEKNVKSKSEYPVVYLDHCFNKTYVNDEIEFCFNEVVTDSRCPRNVNCIWGGIAVAKFTFTKNKDPHPLTLTVSPRDTIVDGYKIQFIDLLPYPVYGQAPPSPDQIRAEVKITRL